MKKESKRDKIQEQTLSWERVFTEAQRKYKVYEEINEPLKALKRPNDELAVSPPSFDKPLTVNSN